MVDRALPDGDGPQRRERDPRRLPGLRHPRRDHRARGRRHRRGRPRPGRRRRARRTAARPPAARAAADGPTARRPREAPGRRRRVGAGRSSTPSLVGSIYLLVRRPQPARRRVRRRPRGRRGLALRYVAGGHRRGARLTPRAGRGRSSAPACCSPRSPPPCRCCSASAVLDERQGRPSTLPLLGHGQGSPAPLAFDIGVYLVVVGLVLMVFEAFGDEPSTERTPSMSVAARPRPRAAAVCSPSAPTWCCSASSAASSSASACSATAATSCSWPPAAAACPPLIGQGDRSTVQRPAAPGAGPHRHRHHLRRHRASCSPSPTAAGCSPTTTRWRTTSRTASSGASGIADKEVVDEETDARRPARRDPTVNAAPRAPDRAAAARRRRCRSSSAGPRTAQRVISIAVLSTVIVLSVVLLVQVDRDGTVAVQAGGWPAPLGITLVADRFSAIMLVRRLGDAAGRARVRHRPARRRAQPRRLPVRVPGAGRRRRRRRSSPATCSTCSSPSR